MALKEEKSPKSAVTALLLCLFLGPLGAHRFYVGKIGTGILMLLTGGGLGIWSLIDLILIACCEFKDKEGKPLIFTRGRGSPVKLILTIVGSVIAAIFVYAILLVTIVLYATSGLTDTIYNQLSALRAGDLEKAYYSYTSKDFQNATSLDDFKKFINLVPALNNNKSASFTERGFTNNEGTVKGTLQSKENITTPVEYKLRKEGGTWKILGIQVATTHPSSTSSMFNTYDDKNNKFSIKYPAEWTYKQANKNSVIFSGKKDTASYYSTIAIETIPTKKASKIHEKTKVIMNYLKKQARAKSPDAKILSEGEVQLPQNPKKFHGEYFVVSYTYKGLPLKKMQFIIGEAGSSTIYTWIYISLANQYEKDLPIAKTMYESWTIQ